MSRSAKMTQYALVGDWAIDLDVSQADPALRGYESYVISMERLDIDRYRLEEHRVRLNGEQIDFTTTVEFGAGDRPMRAGSRVTVAYSRLDTRAYTIVNKEAGEQLARRRLR